MKKPEKKKLCRKKKVICVLINSFNESINNSNELIPIFNIFEFLKCVDISNCYVFYN